MKERPILFSAPMVQALLEGRKTQTRRIINVLPSWKVALSTMEPYVWHACDTVENPTGPSVLDKFLRSPYGVPGDRLYVKEKWRPDVLSDDMTCSIRYAADDANIAIENSGKAADRWGAVRRSCEQYPQLEEPKWRSSMFMPRWASRITLDVLGVRVERVQDISEEDARAEGLKQLSKDGGRTWKWGIPDRDGWPGTDDFGWEWQKWQLTAREAFRLLWTDINGAESLNANPWVWVVSFKVVRP